MSFLLLEDGSFLLLEDGASKILLEGGVTAGTRHQRQAHAAATRCRASRRAGARCRRRR